MTTTTIPSTVNLFRVPLFNAQGFTPPAAAIGIHTGSREVCEAMQAHLSLGRPGQYVIARPQAAQLAHAFAVELWTALGGHQFRLVLLANRTSDLNGFRGVCASHNFCDANMVMAEAFEAVTGHPLDHEDDADVELWNEAWAIARATTLTIHP